MTFPPKKEICVQSQLVLVPTALPGRSSYPTATMSMFFKVFITSLWGVVLLALRRFLFLWR